MAKIALVSENIVGLSITSRTISGNIVAGATPVVRQVLVFKNNNTSKNINMIKNGSNYCFWRFLDFLKNSNNAQTFI